jgi:hypothetical protein
MSQHNKRVEMLGVRVRFLVSIFLLVSVSIQASDVVKLKIGSIPLDFAPWNGSLLTEPLSVQSFRFEVNNQSRRARVVVEYAYDRQQTYVDQEGRYPDPSAILIPGLIFDPLNNAVVYNAGNRRITCGIFRTRKGIFGARSHVESTGACEITSAAVNRTWDDGWTIHRMRDLDLFLEIH